MGVALPLTPSLEEHVEYALSCPHTEETALLLALGVPEDKIKRIAKEKIQNKTLYEEQVQKKLNDAKAWLKKHPQELRVLNILRTLFELPDPGEAEGLLRLYLAYAENYDKLAAQVRVNKKYEKKPLKILPGLNHTALALKLMKQKALISKDKKKDKTRQEIQKLFNSWIKKQRKLRLLGQACLKGYFPLVKKLVAAGMDIQAPSLESGFTPLQSAIWGGHENIARWLLEQGADPNGKTVKEVDENTPLHIACAAENKCTEETREKIVQMLLDCKARVGEISLNGQTPLHLAAAQGNLAVVRLLIDKGADPTIKDKHDNIPLFYAQNAKHSQIVDFLSQ